MNRRSFLVSAGAVAVGTLLPTSVNGDELKVISHRLDPYKLYEISHDNIYRADTIVVTLSDGTECEAWYDPDNVLNLRGHICDDNFDLTMKRGEILEDYVKTNLKNSAVEGEVGWHNKGENFFHFKYTRAHCANDFARQVLNKNPNVDQICLRLGDVRVLWDENDFRHIANF